MEYVFIIHLKVYYTESDIYHKKSVIKSVLSKSKQAVQEPDKVPKHNLKTFQT